ncbi:hypothetical protein [Enterococcus casseliflavus]|uniref:hypothetical protein n=1 Tax=Enterococcus casseliflavus TaxID=37734 RepID=UPI0007642825|nr:hypothetical protein [Enterococcus casseliflavus]OJG30035.1 hypothetical protein RU99_GL000857 [Enterococcus casseliflavus]QQU21676.1 hypothetical protein I6I77_09065 [Enterococcus casseliflavus]STQ31599.1 Uncharacterised protein [Enterococcus casseliflavus]
MEKSKEWNVQFLDVNGDVKYQINQTCTESKAVTLVRKLEQMWRTRPANERSSKKNATPIAVRSMRHL